ncbi:YadA C-terminal domain-containing protein [Fusobacterium sp. SYSU M8A802]
MKKKIIGLSLLVTSNLALATNNAVNNAAIQEQIDKLANKTDATIKRIDGIVQGNKEINSKQEVAINQNKQDIATMDKTLNNKIDQNKFEQDVKNKAQTTEINQNKTDIQTNKDAIAGKLNKVQYEMDQNALNNKINSKLDKTQYESDKKDQVATNKLQDDKIKANHNKITKTEQDLKEFKEQSDLNDKILNNKVVQNKTDIQTNKDAIANKVDKGQQEIIDKAQDEKINSLNQNFSKSTQYDGRISGLEKKVDKLDKKMNKGLSLMAAMTAVDFQHVEEGEMSIGAGIGHYGNAQSVAVGAAYSPTQDLNLNVKLSVTAGDIKSSAVGAGASYKFKLR